MSKKLFALISCVTSAVSALAVGLVTFFEPSHASAINASIPLIEGCIIAVCSNFVKAE